MANEKNLISLKDRATSEQRAIASQGGKASGAARRQYRKMREVLQEMMTLDLTDDYQEAKEKLTMLGLDPSFGNGVNLALILKAATGDVEAIKALRDTIGEKPAQAVEVSTPAGPLQIDERITGLTDDELKKLAQAE